MSDEIPTDAPIILFDGVCNLCAGFVQFIVPRDPEGIFHFASLQSEVGQELLAAHGLVDHDLDSIVLLEGDDATSNRMPSFRSPSDSAASTRSLAR